MYGDLVQPVFRFGSQSLVNDTNHFATLNAGPCRLAW